MKHYLNYITSSVESYVKSKDTNYAIMIEGAWGSGKTYYWNNILRPKIEQIRNDYGIEKKMKTLYISLYGIRSIEELEKKMSNELIISMITDNKIKNALNGNIAKSFLDISGAVGKQISEKLLGVNVDEIISKVNDPEKFLNNLKKGYVLCFDDLERTKIPITEIMGFLNTFVEQDNIKMIIFCNEEELCKREANQNKELKLVAGTLFLEIDRKIPSSSLKTSKSDPSYESEKSSIDVINDFNTNFYNTNQEYNRIKEKLVGKTIKFNMDSESVLTILFGMIDNEKLKKDMNDNKTFIHSLLLKFGQPNIRILKHAMVDLEFIYNKITSKRKELRFKDIKVILVFILTYSIGLKTNQRGYERFKNIENNKQFEQEMLLSKSLDRKEVDFFVQYRNEFFREMNVYNNFFYKFVEVYIREGIFEETIFERELDILIQKLDENKLPVHEVILSDRFFELSNNEFSAAINETYDLIKNGDLQISRYFNAYLHFKYYVNEGLFYKSEAELFEDFIIGIETAENKNDRIPFNKMQLGEIIRKFQKYLNDESDEKVKYLLNKSIETLQNLDLKEEEFHIKEMLDELSVELNIDKLNREFNSIPIFKHANIDNLAKQIFQFTNPNLMNLIQQIQTRYNDSNMRQILQEDFEPLKNLSQLIQKEINPIENNQNPPQLNLYLLMKLNNTILNIIESDNVN